MRSAIPNPTAPKDSSWVIAQATAATSTTKPAIRRIERRLFCETWSYKWLQRTRSELDVHGAGGLALGLEVLPLGEVERTGQERARERLDLGVVAVHGVVVELPRVGDPVLAGGQLLLQVQKVLVRLQVRIGLGQGEDRLQRAAQHVLGLGLLLWRAGRHGRVAGCDHRLEGLALVGGVALDGLDQVRDEVVAPLELHVDLRPGVLHLVPQLDEAV